MHLRSFLFCSLSSSQFLHLSFELCDSCSGKIVFFDSRGTKGKVTDTATQRVVAIANHDVYRSTVGVRLDREDRQLLGAIIDGRIAAEGWNLD